MVTPQRATKVQTHEDVSARDYRGWMVERLQAKGQTVPGTPDGSVAASINWGRWVVECPAGCGDAVVCSTTTRNRFFACGTPGCFDTNWYGVTFPTGRAAIEAALARRPHHPSGLASTWNWRPGERLTNIEQENTDHGVA